MQRNGLASALLDPDVQDAFLVSDDPVALHIFEWSGRYNQQTILDWTVVESPSDLFRAAARVAESERATDKFPTAIGYALGHAATMLQAAPACLAQTVDVSGDGLNNEGFGPRRAYLAFPFEGVVVNGLVIRVAADGDPTALLSFYADEVARGSGAFVEIADGYQDFARTMRRKLLRELTSQMIGRLATPSAGADG